MRSTAKLIIFGILFLPPALLLSDRISHWLMASVLLSFVAAIANGIRLNRRDKPLRAARIAAILAAKPDYVVYGSGAPTWMAVPVYAVFVIGAFALIMWQTIFGPPTLHGVNGFLTAMMYSCALPFAVLAATHVWKALAWRLRSRFPDRVLLFANDKGIGTSDGYVTPYARIRRIDPCSQRSRYGADNWIEIDDGITRKVHLNMVSEPLDDILAIARPRTSGRG